MKKLLKFWILILFCFCLIGCESNKVDLSCSKQISNEDYIETNMTTDIVFKDDKVSKFTLKWSVKYDKSTYNDEEIQKLVDDTAKTYSDSYGGSEGIKINTVKTGDNEYTVNMIVNYNKLSKDEKQKYGFAFNDDLETTKNDFVESGYICK